MSIRRSIAAVSALAVAGTLPLVAAPAPAASPGGASPVERDREHVRADDRTHPLATKRTSLRQRAVDELVAGDARLRGRGADRTIEMADGTEIDYPVNQSAQLLTFLVDFGNGEGNPAFPDQTAGPVHNEIPEPDPTDNSTFWKSNFDRQHYLDLFFNGQSDRGGESMKDLYAEMSSGRFDLQGDVSDWVEVEHPASYYSAATGDETQRGMTAFIGDSAKAWYDAQIAAGKTPEQVKEYLAQYDVWDRYDLDGDGDYNEPDGYIDHFQAIHAGEGEEAGAEPWTIWSHRWAANIGAPVGPTPSEDCQACAPIGGVPVGDTGLYIYDYTTEPENGGLGVFAHEFGHDLGLPDYYDTGDGDNGTGFWNLMSAGSWLGHGDGDIGTTPGQMGATEKLFLGWYGPDNADLATVDGVGAAEEVTLGPSYQATDIGKQAMLVNLPDGRRRPIGPAVGSADGAYLYSGDRDATVASTTGPATAVPAGDATVNAKVSFDIEEGWDYAYLQVSADGGATWANVKTNLSTDDNPNGANLGSGMTGNSGGWVDLTADLGAYAGQEVQLRWEYLTDANTHGWGLAVDSLELGDYRQDFTEPTDWTLSGFHAVSDNRYEVVFSQYYLAENRQYRGYDEVLATGPYSFGYPMTAPNKVDQFPYQDGLLVWYANGYYADNNGGNHPGGGANLPVDAGWKTQVWYDEDGIAVSVADGRQQAYDATFDVDRTDALSLTKESTRGTMTLDVPSRQSTPVFDDSDINEYLDSSAPPQSTWYSTRVAGVGAMIQVVSSDETTGKMVVKVGKRFVAPTGTAKVTGPAKVGGTLRATAPTWFQSGVTATYAWLRDGKAIKGATKASYRLTPADAGHRISVRVTGTKTGYTGTAVTSAATATVKKASVALRVKVGKAAARKKVAVTIRANAPGAAVTGKVKVRYAGKSLRTVALKSGKATVRLPAKKKGSYRLVVTYPGTSGFATATKKVTVRVR